MAKKEQPAKKRGTKKDGPTKKKYSNYICRVKQYRTLPKMYLCASATPGGNMVFTNGAQASKHFTMDKILKDYDSKHENGQARFESELLQRPHMGLSMSCGTIDSANAARQRLPNLAMLEEDAADATQMSISSAKADACSAYEKTGIPAAMKIWESDKGVKLREATCYLNSTIVRDRTLSEMKRMVPRGMFLTYGAGTEANE